MSVQGQNTFRSLIALCLWMFVFHTAAYAAIVTVTNESAGSLSLGDALHFLPDPDAQYDWYNLPSRQTTSWALSQTREPNFGFNAHPYWFSVTINNTSPQPVSRMLELPYGLLDQVDFFVLDHDRLTQSVHTGDQRPFEQRAIHHRHFLVPIDIAPHQKIEILFRVHTTGSLQVPLNFWNLSDFFKHDQMIFSLQIMFIGMMMSLCLYNFIILFVTKDINYLWYILSMASITGLIVCLYGLPAQFLWPHYPRLNNLSLVASISSSLIFSALFTFRFLKIWTLQPIFRLCAFIFFATGACMLFLSPWLPYNFSIRTVTLMTIVEAISAILIGLFLWYRGNILARFYTIAWFAFLTGAIILVLSKWGIITRNIFIENILSVGCVAEGLLLSLALAYRMNIHRNERYAAQQHLLDMQQEANALLEMRVIERTAELEAVNRQLKELSQKDGLTHVYNRAFFEEVLLQEWQKSTRTATSMCLMMIDGDRFKLINDTYGHLCGDACLQHFASVFKQTLNRAGDFVARYGGEEFVILLCHTTTDQGRHLAEQIRSQIEKTPFFWNGHQLNLTVSIGVACIVPHAQQDIKQLVHAADQACYDAKKMGRNQVVCAPIRHEESVLLSQESSMSSPP